MAKWPAVKSADWCSGRPVAGHRPGISSSAGARSVTAMPRSPGCGALVEAAQQPEPAVLPLGNRFLQWPHGMWPACRLAVSTCGHVDARRSVRAAQLVEPAQQLGPVGRHGRLARCGLGFNGRWWKCHRASFAAAAASRYLLATWRVPASTRAVIMVQPPGTDGVRRAARVFRPGGDTIPGPTG